MTNETCVFYYRHIPVLPQNYALFGIIKHDSRIILTSCHKTWLCMLLNFNND